MSLEQKGIFENSKQHSFSRTDLILIILKYSNTQTRAREASADN